MKEKVKPMSDAELKQWLIDHGYTHPSMDELKQSQEPNEEKAEGSEA